MPKEYYYELVPRSSLRSQSPSTRRESSRSRSRHGEIEVYEPRSRSQDGSTERHDSRSSSISRPHLSSHSSRSSSRSSSSSSTGSRSSSKDKKDKDKEDRHHLTTREKFDNVDIGLTAFVFGMTILLTAKGMDPFKERAHRDEEALY
jgi:hypothetical protein